MQNIPNFVTVEVSWDDDTCKLMHKKCHYNSYYSETK